MRKIRLLVINGLAISATAVITGLCGVWFNLLITKYAGSAVLGKFQLIMSVCSFGVTFAISGINFAAMRLCAEGISKNGGNVHKIMKNCFAYALFFGIGGGLIMFALSGVLSDRFIKYPDADICLKIFAVSLPVVSCLSAISGYLTAVRRAYKESFIKVSVQVLKLVLAALFLLERKENPCIMVMAASVISEAIGAVFSGFIYFIDRRRDKKEQSAPCGKLLPLALPMAFSSYLRCGLMTVKNLLVPFALVRFGMSEESAASAFGAIHGIALPVVLFPSTLLFSFASLTVPELAGAHAKCSDIKSSRNIHYIIERSVQLTLIFSAFCAGFVFFFSKDIAAMLCQDDSAAFYIRIFSLIIPVMYLDNTVDSMLKGLNEQVKSMEINIIDSCFCLLMVIFLLPRFGIYGYLFTVCAGEILNFALSFMRLLKISSVSIRIYRSIVVPFVSVIICCIIITLFLSSFCFLIKLPICVLLYLCFVSILGGFTRDDRIWIKNIFVSKNKLLKAEQNN